jgi:hypothetical protein
MPQARSCPFTSLWPSFYYSRSLLRILCVYIYLTSSPVLQEYSMAAQDTMQYLTVPDYATNANLAAQQNMRIETLTRIQRTLVTERPRTMEDCVAWAR